MPEFQLDTSGKVKLPLTVLPRLGVVVFWSDLDAFTQGYIEALFFTENDPGRTKANWTDFDEEFCQGGSIPSDAGFVDLAPETLEKIVADCTRFKLACVHVQPLMGENGYPDERQAGRDFWFTRNSHGVGFWDGDWPEPHATDLERAANAAGAAEVYLGEDGKVYLS